VSVSVDTQENSMRVVAANNRYNMQYFMDCILGGRLSEASLWQANVGRNLSLGDFEVGNAARTPLHDLVLTESFYLAIVQAVLAVQHRIAGLAPYPERLVRACSGSEDEVQYVWALPSDVQPDPSRWARGE
jgi:hypothetical protein